MKKLLIQLDSDQLASTFDQVVGYDAGVDNIISYDSITPDDVEDIVYGAIFTRDPADLNNTAIFIGGSEVAKGEEILDNIKDTFFNHFKVSVMLDSNGANTTAVAAVLKIVNSIEVEDKKAVVLGAGPVGMRGALLLAKEGCKVTLTDKTLEKAQQSVDSIKERFGIDGIEAFETSSSDKFEEALEGAEIVFSAGPPQVQFLTEDMWQNNSTLQVLADVNAVAPFGIAGIEPTSDGVEKDGKVLYGALGIGGLKMKLHKKCIQELFTDNDKILGVENVYKIGSEL